MRYASKKVVLLFSLALALASSTEAQIPDGSQAIYDDALENSWTDESWATVNYSNTAPTHSGSNSISVNAGAYQALFLHHSAIAKGAFAGISFWINGGATGGQGLKIQATINSNAQAAVVLAAPAANTWTQVTLTLAQLGVANTSNFDGFWIQSTSGSTEPVFYVDDITLLAPAAPNPIVLGVNAASPIRAIDGRIFGVNTAIWDSQLNTGASKTLLGAVGTTIMRYPGGGDADAYSWQTDRSVPPSDSSFTWDGSFNNFAALAEALGAQACITVNYGSGTPQEAAAWVAYANGDATNTTSIGTDSKGQNWGTVGTWASLRGAAPIAIDDGYNFLRVSHPIPYGYKYWELGNENYGDWERDDHGESGSGLTGSPNDPLTYAQYFAQFAQQMKAVDPTIKFGAVAVVGEDSYGTGKNGVANPNENNTVHTGWAPVMLHNMLSLGVTPDFLSYHNYPQDPGAETDAGALQSGSLITGAAANLRKMINDYFGQAAGAGIELAATELNSVNTDPGKQTASLVNGLFLADSVGTLSQTEFNVCEWWDLRNGTDTGNNNSSSLYGWRPFGDFGMLASGDRSDTPLNTPYPPYYAEKLLTHWGASGDTVLSGTSNYAFLSVYPIRRIDGSLALLVINKSPGNDLTGQVTVSGFTPSSASATWYRYGKPEDLDNADLSTGSVNIASSTFSTVFPSYSMTVLILAAETASGAQTSPPSDVTTMSAAIGGSADPNGGDTAVYFEYGITTSYGETTATTEIGNGNTAVPVTAALTGLIPGVTYHYRLVATNAGGTVYGPDEAFTTPADAPADVPAAPPWAFAILALLLFAVCARGLERGLRPIS